MNDYKKTQALVISMKTIYLIYIFLFFLLAYESLVFADSKWGSIYGTATLFISIYLGIDYIIAILRYANVITDKKFGGILIFDLIIDQTPRFWGKGGWKPSWKGYALQIFIGLLLFSYFFNVTKTTGEIFSGVPSFTNPAQLTPENAAAKSALVAIPENALSTTLASLVAMLAILVAGLLGAKRSRMILIAALIIGCYVSSLYMADLHLGVYPLDSEAHDSIQKFFLVGNFVSAATSSQLAFDIMHSAWNFNIVNAGLCVGC